MNRKNGSLMVYWIPQVPGKPFEIECGNVANLHDLKSAAMLLDALARYDKFLYENRHRVDYASAGGLLVWYGDEWMDWYDAEGRDIDDTDLGTHPGWEMDTTTYTEN